MADISVPSPRLADEHCHPIRVAHLITNLAMGGAERFVVDLLPAMEGDGSVENRLYLLNANAIFFATPPGITPEVVGFNASWRDIQALRRAVLALREMLVRDKTDILHTHLWICDFLGALAVRGTHAKHLSHTHNTLSWMSSPRLALRLRKSIFAACLRRARTQFVSCSSAAQRHLRSALWLPDFDGAVMPYCIDVERFPVVPPRDTRSGRVTPAFCLGMAGRHVASKGHHVLIEALSRLEGNGPQVRAKIAGDGEERDGIEEVARRRLRHTVFEMVGPVREMPAFFHGIDVLVQPSLSEEGLPVTILEAMCSGVPVIASDLAGAPEIIEDGVNGFLVPPGDPAALAERIEHVRSMRPHELQRLRRNARATILARCAAPAVAARVASVYAAIMRGERISALSTTARVGAVQQITA